MIQEQRRHHRAPFSCPDDVALQDLVIIALAGTFIAVSIIIGKAPQPHNPHAHADPAKGDEQAKEQQKDEDRCVA